MARRPYSVKSLKKKKGQQDNINTNVKLKAILKKHVPVDAAGHLLEYSVKDYKPTTNKREHMAMWLGNMPEYNDLFIFSAQ